jgi:hypothetical protein
MLNIFLHVLRINSQTRIIYQEWSYFINISLKTIFYENVSQVDGWFDVRI